MQNIHDFDWRLYGVTTLSQDLPEAGPGAPFHKAGTPVYPATMAEWDSNKLFFGTPSTVKLAFNIALTASYDAMVAKEQIEFIRQGSGWMVPPEKFPYFYDYFERYMTSVIFSFQTLEIFCNFVIYSKLKKKTVSLNLDKKIKFYSATELQKENISVTKKLLVILPKILGIPSIEENNTKLWENIKWMNSVRNKIVHMKPVDVNRGASLDSDSIFAEIINHSPVYLPSYSLLTMNYYKSGLPSKVWIEEMKAQYETRFLKLLKNREQ